MFPVRDDVLPICDSVLQNIENEDEFNTFIAGEIKYLASLAALEPQFSDSKMHDAYQTWKKDVKRLANDSMPKGNNSPDHFKKAGVLAYWLRRFSPVIGYESKRADIGLRQEEKEFRNFLRDYGETFFAFDIGFQICKFFERNKVNGDSHIPKINPNYLYTACYFLKYKNVSPHALTLIYKSLFT